MPTQSYVCVVSCLVASSLPSAAATAIAATLAPHLRAGESVPDVALLMRLLGRGMQSEMQSLVAAENAHQAELADDDAPRRAREESTAALRQEILDLREILTAFSCDPPPMRTRVGARKCDSHPVCLGALALMAPIMVMTAGVTAMVYVTAVVVDKAVTATSAAIDEYHEKERCKQVKQQCINDCTETMPTCDFGWKFQKCKNECMERKGYPRDS